MRVLSISLRVLFATYFEHHKQEDLDDIYAVQCALLSLLGNMIVWREEIEISPNRKLIAQLICSFCQQTKHVAWESATSSDGKIQITTLMLRPGF